MPIKALRAATRAMQKCKEIVGNSLIRTKRVRDSCAFKRGENLLANINFQYYAHSKSNSRIST